MAVTIGMELMGDKDLQRMLSTLSYHAERRVAKNSVRAGARIIRTPMAENVKRDVGVKTGNLREASKAKNAMKESRYEGAFVITVGPGYRKGGPHAHLVEKGTAERKRKSGASTGKMPAIPYLRPAYIQHKDKALRTMLRKAWESLEREVMKQRA